MGGDLGGSGIVVGGDLGGRSIVVGGDLRGRSIVVGRVLSGNAHGAGRSEMVQGGARGVDRAGGEEKGEAPIR